MQQKIAEIHDVKRMRSISLLGFYRKENDRHLKKTNPLWVSENFSRKSYLISNVQRRFRQILLMHFVAVRRKIFHEEEYFSVASRKWEQI